ILSFPFSARSRISVGGPESGSRQLQQVRIGIAKIDALAAAGPGPLFFNRDSALTEPCFPRRQRVRGNGECDMHLPIRVVWRLNASRGALLEQQQNLSRTRFHSASTSIQIHERAKPQRALVELNRPWHVIDV